MVNHAEFSLFQPHHPVKMSPIDPTVLHIEVISRLGWMSSRFTLRMLIAISEMRARLDMANLESKVMKQETGNKISKLSFIALLCEFFLSFGLFFQPSWSKGWPFVPANVAIALVSSGMAFLVIITVLGLTAHFWPRFCFNQKSEKNLLSILIIGWVGLAILICLFLFFSLF